MRPEAGAQPLFLPRRAVTLSPLLAAEGERSSVPLFLVTCPARILAGLLIIGGLGSCAMSLAKGDGIHVYEPMMLVVGLLIGIPASLVAQKRVDMGRNGAWRFGAADGRCADMYVTDGVSRYAIADVKAEISCRCQGRQESTMGAPLYSPADNRLEGDAACDLLAQAAKEQGVWTGPDIQGAS